MCDRQKAIAFLKSAQKMSIKKIERKNYAKIINLNPALKSHTEK